MPSAFASPASATRCESTVPRPGSFSTAEIKARIEAMFAEPADETACPPLPLEGQPVTSSPGPALAGQLLFIGTPTPGDVAEWAAMHKWAYEHGLETTESLAAGVVVGVVATEDVLDGFCRPAEAVLVQQAHALDVPWLGIQDDLVRLTDPQARRIPAVPALSPAPSTAEESSPVRGGSDGGT